MLGKGKEKVTMERRFSTCSASELETACKGRWKIPSEVPTQLVLRVFDAWRKQANQNRHEKCPDDLLENPTISLLNKWLPALVVEARREDGKWYPAATINQLLAGLWRAARSKCAECPNFILGHLSSVVDLEACMCIVHHCTCFRRSILHTLWSVKPDHNLSRTAYEGDMANIM